MIWHKIWKNMRKNLNIQNRIWIWLLKQHSYIEISTKFKGKKIWILSEIIWISLNFRKQIWMIQIKSGWMAGQLYWNRKKITLRLNDQLTNLWLEVSLDLRVAGQHLQGLVDPLLGELQVVHNEWVDAGSLAGGSEAHMLVVVHCVDPVLLLGLDVSVQGPDNLILLRQGKKEKQCVRWKQLGN